MEWIEGYKPLDHIGENVESRLQRLCGRYELEEGPIDLLDYEKVIEGGDRGVSRGPNPRTSGYTVETTDPTTTQAVTYIAQYGLTNVFKYGYTGDLQRLLSELNQHIPNEDEIPDNPSGTFASAHLSYQQTLLGAQSRRLKIGCNLFSRLENDSYVRRQLFNRLRQSSI